MSAILIFGSVFLYKGFTFIYLAGTDEVWYAAKILDKEKSIWVKKFTEAQIRKNIEGMSKKSIFCFVELKTEEFKRQIAHLGETEHDLWSETPRLIDVQLCKEDLRSLKAEIMRAGAPVPYGLPPLIKDIVV